MIIILQADFIIREIVGKDVSCGMNVDDTYSEINDCEIIEEEKPKKRGNAKVHFNIVSSKFIFYSLNRNRLTITAH